VAGPCKHGNEPSGSIIGRRFGVSKYSRTVGTTVTRLSAVREVPG
jgi:hypothetical protein